MGANTSIEWTDATWNPIRGCSRVSEGCRNCYAERVAHRFSGPGQPYEGLTQLVNGHPAWTGKVIFAEKHLLDPLRWKQVFKDCWMCGGATVRDTCMHGSRLSPDRWRPRRIFVNSMSDLFHESVPDEWIDRIFAVMALCPQHTFQVLTKRPERMLAYLSEPGRRSEIVLEASDLAFDLESLREYARIARPSNASEVVYDCGERGDEAGIRVSFDWPLPNVHLGVSVEDQATTDERIPLLLQTPAAVRFISAEPLLGAMEMRFGWLNTGPGSSLHRDQLGWGDSGLDWVIVGGESGPGARPMHPDWARSLRDQCLDAGVPFFFKQWGAWIPWQPDGGFSEWKSQAGKLMDRHGIPDLKDASVTNWSGDRLMDGDDLCVHHRVGKKAAGSLLDGREWKEFPRWMC